MSAITLEVRGHFALITLNKPDKLNALTTEDYFLLADHMRSVATREDVYITVLTGKGRFFSAGADVKDGQQRQETQLQQLRSASVKDKSPEEIPSHTIKQMIVHSLCHIDQVTEAFASHPKVLVSALNGPVIGLTAALVAYSDFIYAMPHTYLLAPFASIGISAEGGSTATFTRRMGYTRAAEALMMAKRLTCDEMKSCGFINEVFDTDGLVDRFVDRVLTELDERFGRLDLKSTLQIKSLMRGPSLPLITAHTSLETLLVADRLTQRAISVLSPRDRNSRAKLA